MRQKRSHKNFQGRKLPVLDFKCWVDGYEKAGPAVPNTEQTPDNFKVSTHIGIKKVPTGNGSVEGTEGEVFYTFFEKKMTSKFAIMKTFVLHQNESQHSPMT